MQICNSLKINAKFQSDLFSCELNSVIQQMAFRRSLDYIFLICRNLYEKCNGIDKKKIKGQGWKYKIPSVFNC